MLADVRIPPRLVHRPCDPRGYVIPYAQFVDDDGAPNFAVLDHYKTRECLRRRLCGLCGQQMGRHVHFIGGPLCVANHHFYDPPMHRDCAVYALQACPHLARSKGHYRPVPAIDGAVLVAGAMELEHAPYFALMHTTSFDYGRTPAGMVVAKAGAWIDVEYWKDGRSVGTTPP